MACKIRLIKGNKSGLNRRRNSKNRKNNKSNKRKMPRGSSRLLDLLRAQHPSARMSTRLKGSKMQRNF